jgi:hypothetical protein
VSTKSEKKGPMKTSAEEEARFLEYMRAVEGDGPQTTLFELLVSDGVCLPAPDELNDSEVSAKLWEVIEAMWNQGAVLYNTNHLSDRALYSRLFEHILHEDYPITPDGFDFVSHIDVLGSGVDDETVTFLKYYADEETRQEYARNGKITLPEHEEPPFSRDHLLPG